MRPCSGQVEEARNRKGVYVCRVPSKKTGEIFRTPNEEVGRSRSSRAVAGVGTRAPHCFGSFHCVKMPLLFLKARSALEVQIVYSSFISFMKRMKLRGQCRTKARLAMLKTMVKSISPE